MNPGDYVIHTGLSRMAIFGRNLGGNGARVKLLTGEWLIAECKNLRPATDAEVKRGVADIWGKIDAAGSFDGDALAALKEKLKHHGSDD